MLRLCRASTSRARITTTHPTPVAPHRPRVDPAQPLQHRTTTSTRQVTTDASPTLLRMAAEPEDHHRDESDPRRDGEAGPRASWRLPCRPATSAAD